MDLHSLLETIITWCTSTGIKIVIAIIILLIAFKIINVIGKKLSARFQKSGTFDKTLTKTLVYIGKIAAKIVVVACLIGFLGIETGAISAVIASLGVCVGLAVNGTLSNFAGGIMLMVTRPFKLDDFIEAQGVTGTVEEIKICYTKVATNDNKVVHLPNSSLSTGTIINYSEKELRRVDLDFSVAGNDPAAVRKLLLDVCANEATVLKEPEPFARVTDYGAGNGMKITLRAWCKTGDYWDSYFNILDKVKAAFDENNIVVPFDQLDVHIKKD